MKWLRVAEEAVVRRHGSEGLGLTRAVLCDRQSVEATAKSRGAETDREVWFWSRLFRRCLDVLAQAFGFATSTYRPPRLNGHGDEHPADDPLRRADAGELADPRLRAPLLELQAEQERSLPCPSSERTSLLLGGWSQAVAFLQRPGYKGVSSQVHKKGAPTAAGRGAFCLAYSRDGGNPAAAICSSVLKNKSP
jgi:hypothetical protein